ncbi:MAG: TerB family tellurite resistance protein [Deltaproteobacteria bacterium]|nr:TerB family tellurite resistance protein [Deltaproteobacteria bacterium]
MPQLDIGKNLQLLIAAAEDLSKTLGPLREERKRRTARLAAGLSGATSVVASGALLAINIGFWSSIGVALGVGAVPLLIAASAGAFSFGSRKTQQGDLTTETSLRAEVELTYACFIKMANADGRISAEEKVLLRSVLLQYPLSDDERRAVEGIDPDAILADVERFPTLLRRRVLQGTWMLAEADGVAAEEETLFDELAAHLGQGDEVRNLKRLSHTLQAEMNDLIMGMFRICQQVLSPDQGHPATNAFLEALAQIAATPPTRRSLRNSLGKGYSAGGVIQTLNEHGEARKLIAQAANAILSVYDPGEARRAAEGHLMELADASEIGKREAHQIYADVEALFEAMAASPRSAPKTRTTPEHPPTT